MEVGDFDKDLYNKKNTEELEGDSRRDLVDKIISEGGEKIAVGDDSVVLRDGDKAIKVYVDVFSKNRNSVKEVADRYREVTNNAAAVLEDEETNIKVGRKKYALETLPIDKVYEREGFVCTESRYIPGENALFTFEYEERQELND